MFKKTVWLNENYLSPEHSQVLLEIQFRILFHKQISIGYNNYLYKFPKLLLLFLLSGFFHVKITFQGLNVLRIHATLR